MISLIIPTNKTNSEYTNNIVKNIREIYSNETQVEIIISEDDTVTMGVNYNNAVAKAKGEKIILLHNDMVIKPGFVEQMDKDIIKGRITAYTRIEPPIYPDTYAGKVILDCGTSLETFNKDKFLAFNIEEGLVDGGAQMFFGCMKEDYLGIDGYTFRLFCEDDDLHLRHNIVGYEQKVSSAHVYHFVSKTSRTTNNYQEIEYKSNRNFIRKWGFRNSQYNTKYNIGFIVKNCNQQLLEILEPWCSTIYVENYDTVVKQYIEQEKLNTTFDLWERIKPYDNEKNNEILISFDAKELNQNNFQLIQQLPDIIKENGEIGSFQLDIFMIDIIQMNEYQNTFINLK